MAHPHTSNLALDDNNVLISTVHMDMHFSDMTFHYGQRKCLSIVIPNGKNIDSCYQGEDVQGFQIKRDQGLSPFLKFLDPIQSNGIFHPHTDILFRMR